MFSVRSVLSFVDLQAVLRMRDVYPGSWYFTQPGSRILDPDLGSKNLNKREEFKKISYHTFFCSH